MELLDAINQRHSTREYFAETPSDEMIEKLINAAIRAPSAVNRQPWRFTVVSNHALLDKISEKAKDYMTKLRPLDLPEQLYQKLADPNFQVFYHAPVLIVISSAQQAPWIEADCALAAQNLMLAAHASGLGSCWIGLSQPFLETEEGRRLIQLSQKDQPVAPVIVGKPRDQSAPSPRNSAVVSWLR